MAALEKYEWIIAIISVAFCASAFGNGANDVANSYATSIAARTLTMPQVGFLSMCTEFFGAVALGSRVVGTIKNGIIDINKFSPAPATLVLAMGCAEVGSATWLIIATKAGLPVSTTQTVVGALIGVGLATNAKIKWEWAPGSASQIGASWVVSPLISAVVAALLFGTVKFLVLERSDPFKQAMRFIPSYLAFTATALALFLLVELPSAESLDAMGPGTVFGILASVFFGVLGIAYAFFLPYFHRRLVKCDGRVRAWHIPLGPLLYRENPPLYFPGNPDEGIVKDYYQKKKTKDIEGSPEIVANDIAAADKTGSIGVEVTDTTVSSTTMMIEPEERFLAPYKHLPYHHPARIWSIIKYIALQGVTRDCVNHNGGHLAKVHAAAKQYDNRVEHLWTYAQVASAMMMSIAHGSNDVANAVGPWVAAYSTYMDGFVSPQTNTPIWILVIAGFLLGAGFWFFGYHIVRALGNKITQMSPTRGFAIELGSAITVLMASRLGLPVSTTQCLAGATMGVALMNFTAGAVNWKQLGIIFSGWVMTLPISALVSGSIMAMALNTPQFPVMMQPVNILASAVV